MVRDLDRVFPLNSWFFFKPQNEHIELHRKRHGRRFDHYENSRSNSKSTHIFYQFCFRKKKEGRLPHILSKKAQTLRGIKYRYKNSFITRDLILYLRCRAKLYNKRRQNEKIQMKKTIKSHEEKETKQRQEVPEGAVPAYLLDREKQSRAKILSNTIKQKRKEKAVCFFSPLNSLSLQKLRYIILG